MATIVENIEDGKRFILLGSGYGAFRSSVSTPIFGNAGEEEVTKGELPLALVSDRDGKAIWIYANAIRVISVDGQSPAELLDDEPQDPPR